VEYNIIENFRNSNGDYKDSWCMCDYCGGLSEVYVMLCTYNYTPLKVCKGCLTKMIKKMDDTMISDILKRTYTYQEDDGYCD